MIDPYHAEREEEETLTRARRGDAAAFGTLCERHRQRIWRVAASVAKRREDADDLAQTAIVRAFQALPSFRGDTTFEAWLCRISLNAAHDFQRSAWRRRVLLWGQQRPDGDAQYSGAGSSHADDTFASAHDAAMRRETQRRVRAAVAALRASERVPIWLVYFEEFAIAEVARLERVPESTIRSRIKVGLRRLGHSLGDLDGIDVSESGTPTPDGATGANSSQATMASRPPQRSRERENAAT